MQFRCKDTENNPIRKGFGGNISVLCREKRKRAGGAKTRERGWAMTPRPADFLCPQCWEGRYGALMISSFLNMSKIARRLHCGWDVYPLWALRAPSFQSCEKGSIPAIGKLPLGLNFYNTRTSDYSARVLTVNGMLITWLWLNAQRAVIFRVEGILRRGS